MPVVLYSRQKQILNFLVAYIQKHNFSPTLREIADEIGVNSMATIHEHLSVLEKKGIIKRYHGATRGIKLLNRDINQVPSVELPLLGYIAAGAPIEPYENPDMSMAVSADFLSGRKKAFVLQVKGESMVDDGILDGDYVVVEEQITADNGDIVVAVLENGFATLKRFFKEATRIRLEPANSQMSPIFARQVQIRGRVVGVVRRFQKV